MKTNGYITVLTDPGATLNEYGEVEYSGSEWGDPIPALIKTESEDRTRQYGNEGEYSEASYTVLLETMGRDIPGDIKTVRLERYDEDLGEFTVRGMEYVSGHGRMRITV